MLIHKCLFIVCLISDKDRQTYWFARVASSGGNEIIPFSVLKTVFNLSIMECAIMCSTTFGCIGYIHKDTSSRCTLSKFHPGIIRDGEEAFRIMILDEH